MYFWDTKLYHCCFLYRQKMAHVYLAVNFLFQFIFPLFLGMVLYANEFETKEKQKLPEIKN